MALELTFWGIVGVGVGALYFTSTPTDFIPLFTLIFLLRFITFMIRVEERLDAIIQVCLEEDEEYEDDAIFHPPYDLDLPEDVD